MAAAFSLAGTLLACKLSAEFPDAVKFGVPPGSTALKLFAGQRALRIRAEATTLVRTEPRRPTWRQPGNLAKRWREVAGEKNWEGMLEPLDDDLRREIIRVGSFIPILYDGMDTDPTSKYRGSALYHPRKLLEEMNMPGSGYTVTKYLYMLSDADFFVDKLGKFMQVSKEKDEGEFWTKDSNWMGLIAVSTDEEEIKRLGRRDILVAFRGTHTAKEWALNVFNVLWPMQPPDGKVKWTDVVKVEAGFWTMYNGKDETTLYNKVSLGDQVEEEVRRLMEKFKGEQLSISITGHSLGAALATLCAYELALGGVNKLTPLDASQDATTGVSPHTGLEALTDMIHDSVEAVKSHLPGAPGRMPLNFLPGTVPISVYTFGSPRVGNDDFRDVLHSLGVKVLRMENEGDVVTRCPGIVLNEWHVGLLDKWLGILFDSFPWTYIHVGASLPLSHEDSPYLSKNAELAEIHDVETYLHLVDGFEVSYLMQGEEKVRVPKEPEPHRRPFVMVNKNGALLRPEFRVPEAWYQMKNKGVVFLPDGGWTIRRREAIDEPHSFPHFVDI